MSYKIASPGMQAALLKALLTVMILIAAAGAGEAATSPATVAEIALYQGPDRERLLVEGAKKEGQVAFYNSNTWMKVVAQEFERKYPFVKVSAWTSGVSNQLKKVTEEYVAGHFLVDVLELDTTGSKILLKEGLFQEYYSPDAAYYADAMKATGKKGIYYLADREINISLGFNTKLVPPAEAPKTYQDLLDPKWKGKISLPGGSVGPRWVGQVINVMGRDYLEKMAGQDVRLHNLLAAALVNLIASGEVALSPAIFDSNIYTAKKKGAPVEWRPLEPVITSLGFSGVAVKAPHPHAALLLLDFIHSREGQQLVMKGGLGSPREDFRIAERNFKRTYLEAQYSLEEYEKNYTEWEALVKRLFIRKK